MRESDAGTAAAMDEFQALWGRRYPGEDCPVFISNATEAEILEAVDDVIADWRKEHPGEPYPRSVTAATEH